MTGWDVADLKQTVLQLSVIECVHEDGRKCKIFSQHDDVFYTESYNKNYIN